MIFLVAMAGPITAQDPAPGPQESGDLYLQTDGQLVHETDGDGSATCLSVSSPGGQASDEATFTTNLTDQAYRPDDETVTLLLDLGGDGDQAQAGSGFTLTAEIAFGNGTVAQAEPRSYPAGSTAQEAVLELEVEDNTTLGRGPLALTVSLEAQGSSIGAPVGQNVEVLCEHEASRIVSFPYRTQGQAIANPAPPAGDSGGGSDVDLWLVLIASGAGSIGFVVFGLLAATGRSFSQRRIHLMMGISAGLLLAIALVRLVPASFSAEPAAPWTVALGLLGLYSIEFIGGGGHAHAHGHEGEELTSHHDEHDELFSHAASLAMVTFAVFAFHRIVGGLTLPAAFAVGDATGFEAAVGVLIHQAPGGLAAASLFLAGGWERPKVIQGVLVLALFNPIGALVGYYLTTFSGVIGHLLALSAATFIFVALAEVLPEVQDGQYRWLVAGGFVAGYLTEYLVQFLSGFL